MKTVMSPFLAVLLTAALTLLNPGCATRQKVAQLESHAALDWITIAQENFDDDTANITVIQTDPGLPWSVCHGVGRFFGVSADEEWKGNNAGLPVSGDIRSRLEISGDFRIVRSSGYQLVALWGIIDDERDTDGPLCLYFQGEHGKGKYHVQPRWMKVPATLLTKSTMEGFGDETDRFHKMKILLDRARSRIDYFVDDVRVGTVTFDGEIPPITELQMDIETPHKGTQLEIQYDNFTVRSSGPLYQFESL